MKKISKLIIVLFLFSVSFYGQNDTLAIIRHTENDIVIPKDLKVVYRGINNEITIDIPNCKSFSASGKGLKLYKNNIYYLNPKDGDETIVSLDIILKNNKKVTENHLFKVRKVGNIVALLNHQEGTFLRMQKTNLKNAVLTLKFEDKNLINNFISISKFKIKIPGSREIEVQGNRFNKLAYDEINKYASKNTQITIFDICTIMHCGLSTIELNPILINIL